MQAAADASEASPDDAGRAGNAYAAVASNCILQVDGTDYLEGECKFADDGMHAQIGPPDETAGTHRARIQRRPDNHVTG